MRKIINKPEVLAPAGNLEKLKMAIRYGADAVYIGGQAYGLRSRAGNFTYDEMKEGVEFAHAHGSKVYVAANMVGHEGNFKGAGEFFRTLKKIGIDAAIVSDPGFITICMEEAPGLAVHLSTQASATNYKTLEFWKQEGLERVVLAREVSLEEIREIRKHTDMEIEAFVQGAMCISYSGRCVLSNHMANRDANRGGCAQSCRWKYELFENIGGAGANELTADGEPFSMSAVDLTMIHHVPELIEAGVNSFKIEGRMKSIHYVSTVTNVYRAIVDTYCEDPEQFEFDPAWEEEIWKVAQRELATGFYFGEPDENQQLFGRPRKIPKYTFTAQVLDYDPETKIATLQQRNNFGVGEEVEFYGPKFVHFKQTIREMWDEDGNRIERAPNAMMIVKTIVDHPVQPYYLMRTRKTPMSTARG
ncbi:protease [Weizmannia acidilactici]|uniref:Protease n=1 Tax=Weizmannia acidilactici TaxID=2607726 RepID=A0A5J4JCK1_9BACI|nr:U32 family peptidase [Weizmannia acidilactici]GER65701.1 protease [Weizmannia acidilactici]GER68969.1 protease [Weizmannia acidilactici]GER72058.1 protease [Weizmannia acidilactici]